MAVTFCCEFPNSAIVSSCGNPKTNVQQILLEQGILCLKKVKTPAAALRLSPARPLKPPRQMSKPTCTSFMFECTRATSSPTSPPPPHLLEKSQLWGALNSGRNVHSQHLRPQPRATFLQRRQRLAGAKGRYTWHVHVAVKLHVQKSSAMERGVWCLSTSAPAFTKEHMNKVEASRTVGRTLNPNRRSHLEPQQKSMLFIPVLPLSSACHSAVVASNSATADVVWHLKNGPGLLTCLCKGGLLLCLLDQVEA